MPRRGDIAYCQHGFLGLITRDAPTAEGVWTGIHIRMTETHVIGDKWQSKNAFVIGNMIDVMDELLADLRAFAEATKFRGGR